MMTRTALMGFVASVCLIMACPTKASAAVTMDMFLRVDGQDGIDVEGNEVGITLAPNSSFLAQIILREVIGPSDTSFFENSGGLRSVAIGIDVDTQGSTFINGEVSPFSLELTSTPGFTRILGFNEGDDSSSGLIKGISQGVLYLPNVLGGGVTEVFAGQFNVNVGTDGLPTTISLRDFGLGQEFAVASASEPTIDDFINFRSVTITAIPEPSSLVVLGLGIHAMVVRRRRG